MKTLKAGDKAPDITVNDDQGNPVNLHDFKGKKVVLFFYPKANTPTCTVEACNLRDHYTELSEAGYVVLGASPDSEKRQANFKSKFNFPYPLLADTDKELANAFGIWGPKKFMGRTFDGIHRTTFVIDENGVIERVIDAVKAKIHAEQILQTVS